jgi:putative hemolysin
MMVFLVICMVLLSAFFSGVEIAYFSANRLKIELRNKQGEFVAGILSRFIHKNSLFITTLLIGNNIALVVYGLALSRILEEPLHPLSTLDPSGFLLLLIQTILSTAIILLFGEFLPKALFRRDPDRMLEVAALPMWLFSMVLYPLSRAVSGLSVAIMKYVLRIHTEKESLVLGRTDLDHFIRQSLPGERNGNSEHNPEIDTEAFNKALDFNKVRVKDIMVPRIDIVALPMESSIEQIKEKFLETELSRIVIYEETLDQVKGTVHSIELFKKPGSIPEILQPVLIVPETMPASLLLTEFTRNRKTTAIVVDEFGGTSGLVTVEDLVEEILGDIEDEHDEPGEEELIEKIESPGVWQLSARQPVDYLNEKYAFQIPEGDYTTLGGFIMHEAGHIPAKGETVVIEPFVFQILEADQNKLSLIRLQWEQASEADE